MDNEDIDVPIKKKRGRKPKIKEITDESNIVVKEKKKRGRKPKILTEEEKQKQNEQPRIRKRGRKPKYPIESISEIREKFRDKDKVVFSNSEEQIVNEEEYNKTQVSFGNLNITITEKPEINKDELRNMFKIENLRKIEQEESLPIQQIHSPPQSESESEIDNNTKSVVQTEFCKNCMDEDNIEYVKIKKRNVYKQLHKFSRKLKEHNKWPEKTNILCWWCCYSFNTMPIPSVLNYDYYTKEYNLKGIFCSWECSASFTFERKKNLGFLSKLYKEWTGDKIFKVERAPSKYILKSFGGHMSIDEYRKSPYEERKIMLSGDNRLNYINQEILEVYTELEKKKKKKLKLSRKKPLKNNEKVLLHNINENQMESDDE